MLFSDTHFSLASEPEDKVWWPFLVSKMPTKISKAYLATWDKRASSAYKNMLRDAKNLGPYDLIISLGDNIHGTNERGMVNKKARFTWNIFCQHLENSFSLVPKKFVWGGHDVGFFNRFVKILSQFKLGWLLGAQNKSGMTKEAFKLARETMGPPWQSFILERFTFLLLNSEVIRASFDAPDLETKDFATRMIDEQFQFISDNLKPADKAIIVIHDPNVIRHLRNVIGSNAKKVALTLAGHFHLPLIGKIFGLQPFLRKLNFKVVPSPLGLELPFGCIKSRYRFCTLEISGGIFNFNYHK
ncbi:MAG: metallophosphoesterase [Patescibacteria group bacterium]